MISFCGSSVFHGDIKTASKLGKSGHLCLVVYYLILNIGLLSHPEVERLPVKRLNV